MLNNEPIPRILDSDNHPYHIKKHLELLKDPTIRNDETLVATITKHMGEHIQMWRILTQHY